MCDLDELLIRRSKMNSTHFPWIQEKEFAVFLPIVVWLWIPLSSICSFTKLIKQYVILKLSLWALLIRSLSKTQTSRTVNLFCK